jgi:hypothetical protein
MINAAKQWVRNATKVGPDHAALLDSLKNEVGEAHGRRDLALVAGSMRVRDALIWQLRNDRAPNTAVNGRLIKKMETHPTSLGQTRDGAHDAAQMAVQAARRGLARHTMTHGRSPQPTEEDGLGVDEIISRPIVPAIRIGLQWALGKRSGRRGTVWSFSTSTAPHRRV